jgi:hypothetical protein
VTRDSEWDELSQARAEADQSILDSTCDKCGNDLHQSLIDPAEASALRWFVDEDAVCHACAAVEARQRQMHDIHKDDKATTPRPKTTPPSERPLFMDGRIFRARPATPDEIAAAEGGAG